MTAQSSSRRRRGRPWPKGTSGNPGGIPAAVLEARQLALSHAPKAIRRLAALLDSKDPRVRLAAAEGLLDRAGVKAIALDEPAGAGAGATVVVQLAIPQRDVPPTFLAEGRTVAALPESPVSHPRLERASNDEELLGGRSTEQRALSGDAP